MVQAPSERAIVPCSLRILPHFIVLLGLTKGTPRKGAREEIDNDNLARFLFALAT
jgi:hypothetical protein